MLNYTYYWIPLYDPPYSNQTILTNPASNSLESSENKFDCKIRSLVEVRIVNHISSTVFNSGGILETSTSTDIVPTFSI